MVSDLTYLRLFSCLNFLGHYNVAMPLNSFLWAGNVGASLVSYRVDKIIVSVVSVEWAVLTLLISYFIHKSGWFQETLLADNQPLPLIPTDGTNISPSRWRRIGMYLVVAVIGFALDNFSRADSFLPTIQFLPHYLEIARQANAIDFVWLLGLLSTTILSPLAQEIFYRATVYAYGRQIAGMGFGLVFSSLIFSGMHLQSDLFAARFLVGILLATQFEVARHIAPSTVTHGIGNFLAYISHLK